MSIYLQNNQSITKFINIVTNNWNNFPLIDYDEIAQFFINKNIHLVNKILFHKEISNWPTDEHILINKILDIISSTTANQTEYDITFQLIFDYYFPRPSLNYKFINQIINVNINSVDYKFYDINFYNTDYYFMSQEMLNNIHLLFLIYKETKDTTLLSRLKSRYIYPLRDTINEVIVNTFLIDIISKNEEMI